jgi:hypothetical protein
MHAGLADEGKWLGGRRGGEGVVGGPKLVLQGSERLFPGGLAPAGGIGERLTEAFPRGKHGREGTEPTLRVIAGACGGQIPSWKALRLDPTGADITLLPPLTP